MFINQFSFIHFTYFFQLCCSVVEDIPQQDSNQVNDTIEPEPYGLGVGMNIIVSPIFVLRNIIHRLLSKIDFLVKNVLQFYDRDILFILEFNKNF